MDAHFTRRFRMAPNTANNAIKKLVADQYLTHEYDTTGRIFRRLRPVDEALVAVLQARREAAD